MTKTERVSERKREKEKLREAVSCFILLLIFFYWNWISVKYEFSFFLSPILTHPHSSFSFWRQTEQQQHPAGCRSLTKLNNTCQESPTQIQLCNTGGSHYDSIFALLWLRSVYYATKPSLIFIWLTLRLYMLSGAISWTKFVPLENS